MDRKREAFGTCSTAGQGAQEVEERAVIKGLSRMLSSGFCSHKLILSEVDENVHLIILHHPENRANVVIFQHRTVVVQDGTF